MSKITSKVNKNSEGYRENYAYHSELAEELHTRMADAITGGRDHLIDRHRKRGKLLPRERIDLLVDPGTPFLEFSTLAAYNQYGGRVHSAGVVTGRSVWILPLSPRASLKKYVPAVTR